LSDTGVPPGAVPPGEDQARADRIRLLKDRARWTYQRLADEVGVNKGTAESWVYRQVKPNWPHLARLAEVFDVTPGWIETGDETAAPADPLATVRYDVDQLKGIVAHLTEQVRFIAANRERLTGLEESLEAGRRELAEVREILDRQATELLMPIATRLLAGEADRRSSAAPLPEDAERRASTGRRRTDPPRR
jgi:transcriptional regulator with XRE-family HTH domain